MRSTLTPRQAEFVRRYFVETRGNATQAARLAGFTWARSQGPRLLTWPAVAKKILEAERRMFALMKAGLPNAQAARQAVDAALGDPNARTP